MYLRLIMSKTKSLHHIVFATKRREMTISEPHKRELYAYIYGIINNNKCYLLKMNGIGNHIHMLVDVSPTIALAELVKSIKQSSSRWLKQNSAFPMFDSWGKGYYAVSIGVDGIDGCARYIIGQEAHHGVRDFMSEMEDMARRNGLSWYADDWD